MLPTSPAPGLADPVAAGPRLSPGPLLPPPPARGARAAVAAGTLALTGCSQAAVSAADLYTIGCPALDAVAASGSVAGQVAVTGPEKLRGSGQVTGESRQFLDLAITYLKDPAKVPAESKKQIKAACKANGQELKNF